MNSKTTLQRFILTGMQLCWIYVIFSVISTKWFHGSLMFFPLIIGFLGSLGLSVLLLKKVNSKTYRYLVIVFVGAFYLMMLLNISWDIWMDIFYTTGEWVVLRRPLQILGQYSEELAKICMGTSLWVMGWWQVKTQIDLKRLFVEFQFGFGALLIVFLLEPYLKIHVMNSFLIVCGFFILALCGLVISKMIENHESGIGISGNTRLIYSVFSVVSIFCLAGIIFLAVNPKLIELFFSLVAYIKAQFLYFMDFLVRLFPHKMQTVSIAGWLQEEAEVVNDISISTRYMRGVWRLIYVAVFGGLCLSVLWHMSRMFLGFLNRKYTSGTQINHESLPGAFKADLIRAFRQFYQHLTKLSIKIIRFIYKFIFSYCFFSGPDSIRKIYLKMLKWSSKKGFKRQNYQTQYEHINQLIYKFPQTRSSLLYLTGLYTKQRYGNIGPSTQEEDQMRYVWRGLKKIKLRTKKKGAKK